MSDITIPVVIPGLDLTKRETIYYTSKPLEEFTYYADRTIEEAIVNACSLPGAYIPRETIIDGKVHHIIDGGTTVNTPVIPLKQFSNYVIGITNNYFDKERTSINAFTGTQEGFQTMRRTLLSYQKREADLWIELDTEKTKIFDGAQAIEQCEKIGYETIKELAKNNFMYKK